MQKKKKHDWKKKNIQCVCTGGGFRWKLLLIGFVRLVGMVRGRLKGHEAKALLSLGAKAGG